MRILQVVLGFPPGEVFGTEKYTYNLSKELSKHHEVFIFYPINEPKEKNYSINTKEYNGLQLIEINNFNKKSRSIFRAGYLLFNNKSLYINKKIEGRFVNLIETIKPEIVHFQHLSFLSASLIEVCKERKIPILLTLHDFWFICPTSQLLKYDNSLCNSFSECIECFINHRLPLADSLITQKFGSRIGGYIFTLHRFFKYYYKTQNFFLKRSKYLQDMLNKVDLLIAPSNFLREKFIKYGLAKEKVIYSNYGMDTKLFDNFKKKPSKNIRFGFTGGIAPHKGLHVLIDAFNKIKNTNVELKIYGFSTHIFSNYYEKVKRQSKNPNIKFMGKFTDAKIPFSEIDVLIFPSLWYENCPLVIQEAFITKTPVIASNVGAIPEFVEDNKSGLLFERDNPDDLYKKIKLIIDNPEMIEQFKKNIKPVKTIESHTKELEEIYKNLI